MPHPYHGCTIPILEDDATETWWLLKGAFPTPGKAKARAAQEGGWSFTDMRCRTVWLRPQMGLDGDGYAWTFTYPNDPDGVEFWQVESCYVWTRDKNGLKAGYVHKDYADLYSNQPATSW